MRYLVFSALLICCVCGGAAAEAREFSIDLFYKNQSYAQMVQANKEFAENLRKVENRDKQPALNISTIFIAQVLKGHPEYLEKYAQNFSCLSFYEKAILLRGIRSAGMNHNLLNNIADEEIREIVNDPNLLTLSSLNCLEVKEGYELDCVWISFYATGDESYIRKILEVLNRDDEMLVVTYEWINREKIARLLSSLGEKTPPDRADLIEHIAIQLKKKKDYFALFSLSVAAFTSLNVHADADPSIMQAIQKIIKEDPSLDYWKKINKIVNAK